MSMEWQHTEEDSPAGRRPDGPARIVDQRRTPKDLAEQLKKNRMSQLEGNVFAGISMDKMES